MKKSSNRDTEKSHGDHRGTSGHRLTAFRRHTAFQLFCNVKTKSMLSSQVKDLTLIGVLCFICSQYLYYNMKARDAKSLHIGENQHRLLLQSYDTSDTKVPSMYSHVANVWTAPEPSDQAVFWYVAKSGGATFSSIVAKCLGIVQCSPKGDFTGKAIPNAPPAQIITHDDDFGKYLNINPISLDGISTLASEGVIDKKLVDIIISPRIIELANLMTPSNAGRFMVMLRHPVSDHTVFKMQILTLMKL
jgi:hypothetical protein